MVLSPDQLLHSCATPLLNAGVPITTMQVILGHKFIDMNLKHARLYERTMAQHYYEAMQQVEGFLVLNGDFKVREERVIAFQDQ